MHQNKGKFHLAVFQHAAAICRPLWFQNKSVTVHIKIKTMLLFFTGKIIIRECYYRCSESLCLNVPSVFILILNFADWCFILFVLSIGNSHICYSKIEISSVRIFLILYPSIIISVYPVIIVHQDHFIFWQVIILTCLSRINTRLSHIYVFLSDFYRCTYFKPEIISYIFIKPPVCIPEFLSIDLKYTVIFRF